MTPSDGKLIQFYRVPVSRDGQPADKVTICPFIGAATVAAKFDVSGDLRDDDSKLVSCVVQMTTGAMTSTSARTIVPNGPDKWTAQFSGVPTSPDKQTLTAKGNGNGSDSISVTVSDSSSSHHICIATDSRTVAKGPDKGQRESESQRPMIQTLQVNRHDPLEPGDMGLLVEFSGTNTGAFDVGVTPTDPDDRLVECVLGEQQPESITNEDGAWVAVFAKVPSGSYTLRAKTAKGVVDEVRVEVKATH